MLARVSTIRLLVIAFTLICLALIVLVIIGLERNGILLTISVGSYVNVRQSSENVPPPLQRTDQYHEESNAKLAQNESVDLDRELSRRLEKASEKKIILIWYKSGMSRPGGPVGRERCGNCWTSRNRSLIKDESTAAVVFYYFEISPKTMPQSSTRNLNQMYVFWNKEPTPLMRYVHKKELDFEESLHFNATMTYRRDSDFYNIYRYHWINAAFNSKLTPKAILQLKTNLSIALVSDCDWTAGARMRMAMLKKIKALELSMSTYGKCFPESPKQSRDEKDTIKLIRRYKFYFAFENSYRCTDYITEKVYRNSLYAGAVPVVFGSAKSDYEAVLPPGSFIFLEDFQSLQDLVGYLRYLDRNDTAYLEYHKWRTTNRDYSSPGNQRVDPFCQLCRTLYGINVDDMYNPRYSERPIPPFTDTVYRRSVPSLKEYLFEKEKVLCLERNETIFPPYRKYGLA